MPQACVPDVNEMADCEMLDNGENSTKSCDKLQINFHILSF